MKNISKKMIAAMALGLVLLAVGSVSAANQAQRSLFQVGNLTCISCLNAIQAELEGIAGVLGMNSVLDRGIVAVDHEPQLDPDEIAAVVSGLGYPAELIGVQDIEYSQAASFSRSGAGGSGGCGGCGTSSGGGGSGLSAWQPVAKGVPVVWTVMAVDNLTCISCLNAIEAELRGLPGTIGMKSDLNSGRVVVLHVPELDGEEAAAAITGLGYPSRVTDSAEATTGAAIIPTASSSGAAVAGSGVTCSSGSRGPCNASASAWQELYRRYFSKNTK